MIKKDRYVFDLVRDLKQKIFNLIKVLDGFFNNSIDYLFENFELQFLLWECVFIFNFLQSQDRVLEVF